MHQRQADHAVFRIDAKIADQAMRVKVAVLGTDSSVLQLVGYRLRALLERLERNCRHAIVIVGVSLPSRRTSAW